MDGSCGKKGKHVVMVLLEVVMVNALVVLSKALECMIEFWGVCESLRYARSLRFHAVELNVNSFVVVKTLIRNERGSPMEKSLIKKIRHVIELQWEIACKCFSKLWTLFIR